MIRMTVPRIKYLCLFYIYGVTAFLLVGGCQWPMPVVHFSRASVDLGGTDGKKRPLDSFHIGQVDGPEDLTEIVREGLGAFLVRQPDAPSPVKPIYALNVTFSNRANRHSAVWGPDIVTFSLVHSVKTSSSEYQLLPHADRMSPLNGSDPELKRTRIQENLYVCLRDFMSRHFRIPHNEREIEVSLARGESRYDLLGRRTAGSGDFSLALSYFLLAIDTNPEDHAALFNAGVTCEATGQYERALRFYRRAIKLSGQTSYVETKEALSNFLYRP